MRHHPLSSLIPPLSYFLYTPLSRVGSDQASSKWAGEVHCEKREVAQKLHTHRQASLMVSRYTYTCPTPGVAHWTSP